MALPEEIDLRLTKLYGEIAATFTITEVPAGGAPEHIKQDWVGVSLPVRSSKLGAKALEASVYFDELTQTSIENVEPVTIVGVDALEALRESERDEAAAFWIPYALGEFVFRAHEGVLTPKSSSKL